MKRKILWTVLLAISTSFINSCTPKTGQPTGVVTTQQEVKITGSGSTYPALESLVSAYEAENQAAEITFLPQSQSDSGIVAVNQGLVNLGGVSRKLKPQEKSDSIEYRELAKDALVVATHSSVEDVTNLNTEQLKGIYSGEITNWQEVGGPNAEIVVLDRPEDESGKRLLREYYLGKELKNAPEAIIMRQEGELIEAVEDTAYSIGAFSLAYAIANDLSVNRLSLDGVEPTAANVKANKYEMVRNIGIIYNPKPSKETQKFLDFIFSEEGAKQLQENGFISSF